ncbi:hypothetical protein [Geodermatophilus sabuli]|uniref:PLD phosphodiesterase domain-containing protein n=1 Tax=Geodermatophilus sabuli TaxID=1564158 RepID=A0A285EC29_9ACTN|nr:hypothetical protein [Geodermatophilus sabuli]MBB3084180.1 phosphatidylserine/phosphatidylglycerophosphate/cardiolipin synthase-like enzyme [Geodermatophilus sabuli]SNX96547.1 hypothetical protein SAMN06893097_104262 [Geodermatophilus sabuli]
MTPLADLVTRTCDSAGAVAAVRAATADGAAAIAGVLVEAGADRRLLPGALEYAGVTATATPLELAAIAGALEVLVASQRTGQPSLVLTVPEFLTGAYARFLADHPAVHARRTSAVLAEVAAGAEGRLLVAAPYLTGVALERLVPHAGRVLTDGGTVCVITRALTGRSPEPSPANIAAVGALRRVTQSRPGRLLVRSWEGPGLGVHLKAVIADRDDAYLGSANMTDGGHRGHAEAGVRLPAAIAGPLADWLEMLAGALTEVP